MRLKDLCVADGDRCTCLPNGVVIYTRPSQSRAAAFGLWLENGVRDERPSENGYAHLMEHLLFKGAERLDSAGLARVFEAMGGQINAYTGREHMVLHGFVPGPDVNRLAQLFAEMLTHPVFTDCDVRVERDVVLQEMAMIREDPEEAMADQAVLSAWGGHPMSRAILGTSEIVQGAEPDDLRRYVRGVVRGGRILVVAAGAVDHDRLVEALNALATLPSGVREPTTPPEFHPGISVVQGSVTQTHMVWLMPGPSITALKEADYAVANHILGGGASSRLFLEVRENLGLAYDIQTRLEPYEDTGLWSIETACAPDQELRCREAVRDVVDAWISRGVTADELEIAQQHLLASLVLEDGDPRVLCDRLARDLLARGAVWPDVVRQQQIHSVRVAGLATLLQDAWAQNFSLTWSPEAPDPGRP